MHSSNAKLYSIFTGLVLLILLAIWLNRPTAQVITGTNTRTNFTCEMQGKWSSMHFDVSKAEYMGQAAWTLTYRDTGKTTLYIQRQGEDCRVETFPVSTTR